MDDIDDDDDADDDIDDMFKPGPITKTAGDDFADSCDKMEGDTEKEDKHWLLDDNTFYNKPAHNTKELGLKVTDHSAHHDIKVNMNGKVDGMDKEDEVKNWLSNTVGLPDVEYYGKFKVHGYDCLGMMKNIDDKELKKIGIDAIEIRIKIMYYVKNLRKQYVIPMDNDDSDNNDDNESYHSSDSDIAYPRHAVVKQTSARGLGNDDNDVKTAKPEEK
eukprot:373780_1